MATVYAWTDIRVGEAKEDQKSKGKTTVIKYGDTVSASQVGGEDELQSMFEAGSVRKEKPPKLPDTWQGSPLAYLREENAKNEDAALLPTTGGSIFAPSDAEVLTGAAPEPGKDK